MVPCWKFTLTNIYICATRIIRPNSSNTKNRINTTKLVSYIRTNLVNLMLILLLKRPGSRHHSIYKRLVNLRLDSNILSINKLVFRSYLTLLPETFSVCTVPAHLSLNVTFTSRVAANFSCTVSKVILFWYSWQPSWVTNPLCIEIVTEDLWPLP